VRFASETVAAAHVLWDTVSPELTIDGDAGHHLRRVLRLRRGETVTVADGAGSWRTYRVAELVERGVELAADGEIEQEPVLTPSITVAFALTKRDKPELVVQKLTELGVDRIVPVTTERSVVRWDRGQVEAAHRRFIRIAMEACAQSRRARMPEVGELTTMPSLLAERGVVVADRGGSSILDLALDDLADNGVVVLVGPEGGFSTTERALLHDVPTISLGPHVLRAETAALSVAACLTAHRARYYNGA
jgi:16S rRNA (uracil1498-N3)-methyltransferase